MSESKHTWCEISSAPENVVVETKIDDATYGARNETTLIRRGPIWWYPDGSMYVYYRPTHWRHTNGLHHE